MKHQNLVAVVVVGRLILAAMCIAGSVWLISQELQGWGWLIFLGALLSAFTISNDGDGSVDS